MQEHFSEVIRKARKCARLTVEMAAEKLFLSPRMLNYYEAGKWNVPDDVVARMVDIYETKEIGYRWLSRELQTGRLILPANPFSGITKPPRLAVGADVRKDSVTHGKKRYEQY